MSTYETTYCNTNTDLTAVVPNINQYDQKKLITNWETHSGNVYRSGSVGYVESLFQNGRDLGAAQADLVSVTTTDQWFYDSTADIVYFYSTSDPQESRMEGGVDWATLKTRIAAEQAERIRAYLPFPVIPRKGVGTESASSRVWDWVIVRSNAVLTCAELVRYTNQELADGLEKQIIDREDQTGLLDMLRAGKYTLWNQREHQTQVRDVSINANTTGAIVDLVGTPNVSWDVVKIIIETGGTLTAGTASSITYSTYGRDDTGVKTSQLINTETITGGFDNIGYGVAVRFSPGVYTANDEWEVELSSGLENPQIKTMDIDL